MSQPLVTPFTVKTEPGQFVAYTLFRVADFCMLGFADENGVKYIPAYGGSFDRERDGVVARCYTTNDDVMEAAVLDPKTTLGFVLCRGDATDAIIERVLDVEPTEDFLERHYAWWTEDLLHRVKKNLEKLTEMAEDSPQLWPRVYQVRALLAHMEYETRLGDSEL